MAHLAKNEKQAVDSKAAIEETEDLALALEAGESTLVEDVEDAGKLEGERIPAERSKRGRKTPKKEQPAMVEEDDAANASLNRNSHERKQDESAYVAARDARQDDAATIGRYLTAQNRNNVMMGTISGVEVRGKHTFWVIYDGPVVVMIPFRDALPYLDSITEKTPDFQVRQTQLLTKSVGAEIPFTVEAYETDADSGTFLVYGSRRNAMERIRNRYFGAHASKPVAVDDTVQAKFLAVGPHAAWVSVMGVDVRIRPQVISHRYMDDMTTVYKAGDEITMRVQGIGMENGLPTLNLSALPCELEESRRRLNRIRQGNRYKATITSHRVVKTVDPQTKNTTARYVATMWLEGVNVAGFATVAHAHAKGTAHSGDEVLVEVDSLTRNGYARCRIIAYVSG